MTIPTINRFDGEFEFLSNFHNAPVTYQGYTYLNSEAAFQAQKEPSRASEFTNLPPNKAKRLGRRVNMRPDWDVVKDEIMLNIVRNKFDQNPNIASKLIATGNTQIIEGNWWNDTYWGVCKGIGKNKLGMILMQVRNELKHK